MAKGYNVIYRGPADGANQKPMQDENVALEADILPGMILSTAALGYSKSAVAATVFGQAPLVAEKDSPRQKNIADAWVINENMLADRPRSGEYFNVMVITAQALVKGLTPLSRSATAGVLKIALTDGTEDIIFYADETTTTTGTQLVHVYRA